MRLYILPLAAVLVTFAGIGITPALSLNQHYASSLQRTLAGSEWTLESIGGESISRSAKITLKFGSDGRAGGSGGCNSYSGAYRQQGQLLSFSRIISTKRACLEQIANQQEQRYLNALENASRFRSSGDRLTIFYGGPRSELNFVNDSPSSPEGEKYENLDSPVELLASFYNAISNRDYERAYRYWETPPSNLRDFERGYRNTTAVELMVQPLTHLDGAAGSIYAEVPTFIVAGQRDGSERVFAGCYVMRKSNVGGADVARSGVWRIYKASLSPVAANAAVRPKLLAQACTK